MNEFSAIEVEIRELSKLAEELQQRALVLLSYVIELRQKLESRKGEDHGRKATGVS